MASQSFGLVLQHIRTLVGGAASPASSDAKLLERFVMLRDEAAFAALVEEYGPMVLRVCRAVLRDEQEAEDASQATFLVLARRAGSLDCRRPLGGWLHAVAARIAAKARANAAKRRRREKEAMDLLREEPARTSDPEQQALLHEELKRLPDKYRVPLVLCYLQGKTHEQAARELGRPVGSMSWYLGQGVELLRKRLIRRGMTVATSVLVAMLVGPASGAMPAALLESTVRAAVLIAWGKTVGEAVVSATAALLAQGACLRMVMTRVKIAAVVAIAICVVSVGVGGMLLQGKPAAPPANREAQASNWIPSGPDPDPLPPGAIARLGSTRLRPGSPISSVAFSPDGRTLVSGNWGASIHFWEVATGKELRRIAQDQRGLRVELTADGRFLASAGGNDKVIQLWDAATGQKLRQFVGHQKSVTCFAFAPDGDMLAASADKTVRIWRVATGEQVQQLDRAEIVYRMAWSKDSKILAFGTSAGKVCLWDFHAAKSIHEMAGHEGPILQLCWSPDDKILATGGFDGTICLWDPSAGREMRRLGVGRREQSQKERKKTAKMKARPKGVGYLGTIQGLVFSANGKFLYSSSQDFSSIFVWDVATGEELRRIESPQQIFCLARSRDGRMLAAGGGNNRIDLWNLATETLVHPLKGPQGRVGPVAFSPDGSVLATGSDDESIHIWQTGTWREIERLPRSDSQVGHLYVEALKFSPNGKLLAVGGPWHRITVWDWAARKEVRCFLDQSLGGSMSSLAFSPDGEMLAAPFHGTTVWNMTTGKELRRFDARGDGSGGVWAVAFSPNGRHLALGGTGVILLFEPATGKIVLRFNLPTNSQKTPAGRQSSNMVRSMAFSRDGKSLLSGSYDAKLRLWEVATGKERRLFQGHELPVHSVALSPDEKYAVSASGSIWEHQDNSVRVWNVATGKELRKFTAHQNVVISVAFSPDGKVLASGSEDGTTLIWDMTALGSAQQSPVKILSASELESLWEELAGDDTVKAYEAIQTLTAAPAQAEAFLRTRLKPVAAENPKQVRQWIADLDSDRFAVRTKAAHELENLGEQVESALRIVLDGKASPELRRQIESLLKGLDQSPSGNRLRELRAVEVLEHLGTIASQRLLRTLAGGAAAARLTQEAKASLNRLN